MLISTSKQLKIYTFPAKIENRWEGKFKACPKAIIKGTEPLILARPRRIELLTPRFVVWYSIQLSYGRTALV